MLNLYVKKRGIIFAVLIALNLASCRKEPQSPGYTPSLVEKKFAPDGFNYSTTKSVKIEIRLLTNNNRPISGVPVTIYDPRATFSNASLFKTISDINGNVSGSLTIPAYLDTMLVKTNYIGLPIDVRVKVVHNALSATIGGSSGVSGNIVASVKDISGFMKMSTSNNVSAIETSFSTSNETFFSYPVVGEYNDLFITSGSYQQSNGRPVYLSSGRNVIPADLLEDINASLPEGKSMGSTHPDYLESTAVNTLKVVKNSEVWVTFVHEGAGYLNSLAYYVYDTNSPPATASDIENAVFVFPNASAGSNGALIAGDKVKIGTIPAGKSIGFILLQDAWKDDQGPKGKHSKLWGVKTDVQKFYSHSGLNGTLSTTLKKHSVMLYDNEHKLFIMGFEDLNRQYSQLNPSSLASDNDFNDLVIYMTATPVDGISTDGVVNIDRASDTDNDGVEDELDEYPTDGERAYNKYYPTRDTYGTLTFEDNWPLTGDYDLNDLVVKYRYTYVSNSLNKVVELLADYDVAAAGATNKNGFGVEFPFSPSDVSQVTGQKHVSSYIKLSSNGLEAGQSKAVIIPFDNHNSVLRNADGSDHVNTMINKEKVSGEVVRIKVKFTAPILASTLGDTPFNPFLISNGRRGYEIHLPGFKPTDKGNKLLFGTEADDSSEVGNRYYLTNKNEPWVLHFTEPFKYPVEYTRIWDAYPHFSEWALSNGNVYKDWYNNTAAGYQSPSQIYSK